MEDTKIKDNSKDIFNTEEDNTLDIVKEGISFNSDDQKMKSIEKNVKKVTPIAKEALSIVEDLVPGAEEAVEIVKEVGKGVKKAGAGIQEVNKSFKEMNKPIIKKKIDSIEIGSLVTSIYGDFENQKVINGKVMSITNHGITIMSKNKDILDPVVIKFDDILDIFKVKKFKKRRMRMSMFKVKKALGEFLTGTEEEKKEAYKQKITVKELRKQLKNKKIR